MRLKVFWIEPTDYVVRSLRRFVSGNDCPSAPGYHNASVVIDRVVKPFIAGQFDASPTETELAGDPRWPTHCSCGYAFSDADRWQVNDERLYAGAPTGLCTLRDAPPGALYDAWWLGDYQRGPDGRHLIAVCPNGRTWEIDGRASNCTLPHDSEHRCWTRHGDPTTGNIDVGKQYGPTCGAGAGSILFSDYHGFLQHGYFI